jgi:hypothetical protein
MPRWEAFFAAQLAAAATLAGLLFVGVSLNLTKILANPSLPGRALSGFYLLLANLIVASLMLMPDQPRAAIGGGLVLAGSDGGFYWVAAAMVISLFVASSEAWVLLVEINR